MYCKKCGNELENDVKFFDKNGKLIGAKSKTNSAVEKGTETIMYFITDEVYDKLEYQFSVSQDDYNDCIITALNYTSTPAKNKEILSVTNNSDFTGYSVEGYAIFFNRGEVIDCESEFISDNNGLIEPKKTITKEFDCLEEYDTVKFYFTGYGEK